MTLGPTREPLDSVRFLTNPSSGKMGYAFVEFCKKNKVPFKIVGDPQNPPTAFRMYQEVKRLYRKYDICIFVAAICDYRFYKTYNRKLKTKLINTKLIRNPDVAGSLKKLKKQIFVGFALEDSFDVRSAIKKMTKKNFDIIVLNTPKSFGSDYINSIVLYKRDGKLERIKTGRIKKTNLAGIIFEIIKNIKN
ncbi:MAG: phosphopantothenoylcysteine decarboxylase [bacterium]|nr:phosphopantothenoylcysteine decarboxylase [bacterium]